MAEDLGMLFIPDLHVVVKVYKDEKGKYVKLPRCCGRKFYLKQNVTIEGNIRLTSEEGLDRVWAARKVISEAEGKTENSAKKPNLNREALEKHYKRQLHRDLRDLHALIDCREDYLEVCRNWLYGKAEA